MELEEVSKLLFGPGIEVAKSGAAPSYEKGKRPNQAAHRAALAGNTVAVVGGTHALGMALGHQDLPGGRRVGQAIQGVESNMRRTKVGRGYLKALTNKKVAAGAAAGWVGLHGVELAADLQGRNALKQNYKRGVADYEKRKVSKMSPGSSDVHQPGVPKSKLGNKLRQVSTAIEGTRKAPMIYQTSKGVLNAVPDVGGKVVQATKDKVQKNVVWEGEFSKVDSDKRQVFGWASIVEVNGEPVVDLQGDYIDIDEIEKSAYDYVIKSRKGGDMHRRNSDDTPLHLSDMIESFVVTPEKKEALGLPDSVPNGWWVGYKINDPEAWNVIKSGKRLGFSIHGRGMRTPDYV
jgi:hypothetical protein